MPSNREVERVLGVELLGELRHYAQTSTQFLERLSGQIVNHTLEVWSGPIPSEGFITREWAVAAGSIKVAHWGAADEDALVISSAGPGDAGSPPSGTGTWRVFPGTIDVVPVASRQITIYGPVGTTIGLQAFTAAVQPVTTAVTAWQSTVFVTNTTEDPVPTQEVV